MENSPSGRSLSLCSGKSKNSKFNVQSSNMEAAFSGLHVLIKKVVNI